MEREDDLKRRGLAALAEEQRLAESERRQRAPGRFNRAAWIAAAVVLALGAFVVFRVLRPAELPEQVRREFLAVDGGESFLEMQTPDPVMLQGFFTHRGLGFEAPVRDLASSGFGLEGGRLRRFDRQPAAVVAYRGPQGKLLLCVLLETDHGLPADGRTHREYETTFSVFDGRGVSVVFWEEGRITYALAGAFEPDRLASLAVLKQGT